MTNPPDTNQASGLFELCKEVYEATGWDDLADDHDWFKKKRPAIGGRWSLKGVKRRVTTKKSLQWVLYHNSLEMSIDY